jgi:hypothetical protein
MNTSNEMKMKLKTRHKMALALLACVLPLTLHAAPPKVGDKAPDFALKTLEDHCAPERLDRDGKDGARCSARLAGISMPTLHPAGAGLHRVGVWFCVRQGARRHGLSRPGGRPQSARDRVLEKQAMAEGVCLPYRFKFHDGQRIRFAMDAPGETAYPSTFVLDRKGVVRFAKISRSHGDRTKSADILEELKRFESN